MITSQLTLRFSGAFVCVLVSCSSPSETVTRMPASRPFAKILYRNCFDFWCGVKFALGRMSDAPGANHLLLRCSLGIDVHQRPHRALQKMIFTPAVSANHFGKGSSTLGSDSSLSGQVFLDVNFYRAPKGRSALVGHAGLHRLAQQHCDYLVKARGSYGLHGSPVSHMGFESRVALVERKYSMISIGEDVASSTSKSSSHIVKPWIGSKDHDYNMRSNWTCTGVATAVTPEGIVISTQIFETDLGVGDQGHSNTFNYLG